MSIYKKQFKIDQKSKHKSQNHKVPPKKERNHFNLRIGRIVRIQTTVTIKEKR